MTSGFLVFMVKEQKKFMLIKSESVKRLVFDSTFFTYSVWVLIFSVLMIGRWMGFIDLEIDQEWAITHMRILTLATVLVGGLMLGISSLMAKWNCVSLGEFLFADPKRKQIVTDIPFFRSFWGPHLLATLLLTFLVSFNVTEVSIYELTDPDGLAGAWRLFKGLADANLELLPTAIVKVIETVFIAFLGTAIAIPISFFLSFICAKNIMIHPVAFFLYFALRTILNVMRSVEPLIWAIIFTVWVGVGPFAGMLALMIHSIASLTKQYSEIVEGVAEGPIEGIRSTGANSIQVIWFAVVPQIVLPYIAFTIYRWDINVRMATVIGLVGGGGIGTLLIKYQGQAMWREVGCIILVIAAVVWLMDTASAYIREALK